MTIYMVTWKTFIVNGNNSEGSFFSELDENKTIEEWVNFHQHWVKHVEDTVPDRQGGKIIITGVFKL